MAGVPGEIVERQLAHIDKVHADYSVGVRQALKEMHGYEANAIPATDATPQTAAE